LSFYLDIIETHITNQITTKANTFFNAIHSQDEVQEHVLKTCTAVKCLRRNLNYIDEKVVLASIRIIKLINLKIKYRNLIEKVIAFIVIFLKCDVLLPKSDQNVSFDPVDAKSD
jgi:hypothetical protein